MEHGVHTGSERKKKLTWTSVHPFILKRAEVEEGEERVSSTLFLLLESSLDLQSARVGIDQVYVRCFNAEKNESSVDVSLGG